MVIDTTTTTTEHISVITERAQNSIEPITFRLQIQPSIKGVGFEPTTTTYNKSKSVTGPTLLDLINTNLHQLVVIDTTITTTEHILVITECAQNSTGPLTFRSQI